MSSQVIHQNRGTSGTGGRIPALALLVTIVCMALLAASGFYATLSGTRLGGLALLGHVGFGGAYAVALAVLAICRSGDFDLEPAGTPVPGRRLRALGNVGFWVMVAAGLCLILSSGLMMLPQFGTEGQEMLIKWHRLSGIVAVAAGILYGIAALGARRRS